MKRLIAMMVVAPMACAAQLPPPGATWTTDEMLGVTPWQELKLEVDVSVSMYELIVNGEKYDDQYIQVQGFFKATLKNGSLTETPTLYADRDSLEYRVIENSIRILDMLPDCYSVRLEELDGEFLLMSGVFRAKPNWQTLTPVDHIRLYKLNEETREIEINEILCRDDSLIKRQLP